MQHGKKETLLYTFINIKYTVSDTQIYLIYSLRIISCSLNKELIPISSGGCAVLLQTVMSEVIGCVWTEVARPAFTHHSWIIDFLRRFLFFFSPMKFDGRFPGLRLRDPGPRWPFKSGSVDSVVFPGSLMETEREAEKDPIVYALFSMGTWAMVLSLLPDRRERRGGGSPRGVLYKKEGCSTQKHNVLGGWMGLQGASVLVLRGMGTGSAALQCLGFSGRTKIRTDRFKGTFR